MAKSLLDTFRSLDQRIKDTVADVDSPLLLSFAALDISNNEAGVEWLTAEHITACLEAAGVAVQRTSVSRALARAGNRVSTSKSDDNETQYKLMTKGKREIENLTGGESMAVIRIESGQPRTARLRIGKILSGLKGVIRVCDPYYGIKTLDTLDHIPKSCSVRFLTARCTESKRKIKGAIGDFKKERPKTEFRRVPNPSEIHDRYILSTNILLLLGHGLKDIGGKESFVIRLGRELVPDLLNEVRGKFDDRWNTATQI